MAKTLLSLQRFLNESTSSFHCNDPFGMPSHGNFRASPAIIGHPNTLKTHHFVAPHADARRTTGIASLPRSSDCDIVAVGEDITLTGAAIPSVRLSEQ